MGGSSKPGMKPPSEENKGLHGQGNKGWHGEERAKKEQRVTKKDQKRPKKTKKEAKQMGARKWGASEWGASKWVSDDKNRSWRVMVHSSEGAPSKENVVFYGESTPKSKRK